MAGKFDPNQAQNLPEIEKQFAVKAVEQAQTYWSLLEKIPPRELRLTRYDDEIFEHTLRDFPEFAAPHSGLNLLDESWMKSDKGKERWRAFIKEYENKIADFNFGSLIRTDATKEYDETNTIFVTRIQFYAIEISRNRLGLNDVAHERAKEEARNEREKAEKKRAGKKKSDAP
ncbi:polysaccharide biosynthesis-domain-containing protein [Russula dissimulans]|nr:polysaccharide biosynthesis-domain-containing protein [Russula dissimulans]